MFGRRGHVRLNLTTAWNGILRILQDVVVLRGATTGEFVAISREPAVVGESLTLDLTSGDSAIALPVQVEEVRPVMVDGALRHRLVLKRLWSADAGVGPAPAAQEGNDDRLG